MTDNVLPFPAARVRTPALDEHLVRIISYGDVICYDPGCSCIPDKATVIVAFRGPGTELGITLGALVAAVEAHRSVYMPVAP